MTTSTSKMLCARCGYVLMEDMIRVPSFPVPDLVRTPRIATQSEANLVRRALLQVHTDMSRLDDQIKRLQETTQELLRAREVLYKYTTDNEAILTPIERLPVEVLSAIFICLLPPSSSQDVFKITVPRKVVMLSAQICRRWRKVALSTPQLYTSITIGRRPRRSVESEVALMRAWLPRSGSLPLLLTFAPHRFPLTDFHPVVDEALSYSDRWQSISLAYPLSSISNLDIVKGRLPCLESLKISFMGDIDAQMQPITAFEVAPQLRSVEFVTRISPDIFTIPWTQLTNFTADTVSMRLEDCLDVLALCPNLATCVVTWCNWPLTIQRPPIQRSPIQLLHLHSLRMEALCDVGDFFNHLSLPALRDCEYDHGNDDMVWDHSEFISFLSRSQCPLQRLVLHNFETVISNEELILCLEHLPNLVELEILTSRICEYPSTALVRLTNYPSGNDQACLVPKLKFFKIIYHIDFDHWAFAEMIESRWRPEKAMRGADDQNVLVQVEPIQTVKISLDYTGGEVYEFDPEVLGRFLEFRGGGLDIDIYDANGNALLQNGQIFWSH